MTEARKGFPISPDWAKTGHDPVTNPAHYTQYPVEVIELAECLNYNRGNILKYVCRAGLKDPDKELEDLEKALWYVQREIARVKRGQA